MAAVADPLLCVARNPVRLPLRERLRCGVDVPSWLVARPKKEAVLPRRDEPDPERSPLLRVEVDEADAAGRP